MTTNESADVDDKLERYIPDSCKNLLDLEESEMRSAIPEIAKNPGKMNDIESAIESVPTDHRLIEKDAREIETLNESIGLVVTSPPYFDLKDYEAVDGQLGNESDFGEFSNLIRTVWQNCYEAIEPGGRLCVVVGDVLRSRSEYGRHRMVPLHAKIIDQCESIGFDTLSPIIWYKIGNTSTEAGDSSRFLGKPYEPGAAVENDIEYVLIFRKPGGYRSPSRLQRILSTIGEDRHKEYFTQVWQGVSGEPQTEHPAPYPVEIADRLIRMYSFVGDTVLDPFAGSGTTAVAASRIGRNSLNTEIVPEYVEKAKHRLENEKRTLVNLGKMTVNNEDAGE